MGRKDFGFELRPDSQFVPKEGIREEIDQIRLLYIFQLNRKVKKRHFCQKHVNLETLHITNCSEHCQVDFS